MYQPQFRSDATYTWGGQQPRPYNPIYFLTDESCAEFEKLLAAFHPAKTEMNAMVSGGPVSQSVPNNMLSFKDDTGQITDPVIAGVLAAAYWNHGYPEDYAMQCTIADIQSRLYRPS